MFLQYLMFKCVFPTRIKYAIFIEFRFYHFSYFPSRFFYTFFRFFVKSKNFVNPFLLKSSLLKYATALI